MDAWMDGWMDGWISLFGEARRADVGRTGTDALDDIAAQKVLVTPRQQPGFVDNDIVKDDVGHRVGVVPDDDSRGRGRRVDGDVSEDDIIPSHLRWHGTLLPGRPRPQQ